VELFVCVLANSRGLKGASSRRQNVLTGQDAKTPYASKKKRRMELQKPLLHPPYYQVT
jgi:hypothetical protein